jgi:hypothetical protein
MHGQDISIAILSRDPTDFITHNIMRNTDIFY